MESSSNTDPAISNSSSETAQQPPAAPPPPGSGRNWLVILVVALVGALMIFAGIRNAKKSSSVADRAAMVGNVKGKLAPDFTLKTLDGKPVKLSDLRGKAVLLNFWATWCEPCKVEIPWFVDLQKQYAGQGLQFGRMEAPLRTGQRHIAQHQLVWDRVKGRHGSSQILTRDFRAIDLGAASLPGSSNAGT